MKDKECEEYVHSANFIDDFSELLNHDREKFSHPDGWQNKTLKDSPLITDWKGTWQKLSPKYSSELPPLAYNPIPSYKAIEVKLIELLSLIGHIE